MIWHGPVIDVRDPQWPVFSLGYREELVAWTTAAVGQHWPDVFRIDATDLPLLRVTRYLREHGSFTLDEDGNPRQISSQHTVDALPDWWQLS